MKLPESINAGVIMTLFAALAGCQQQEGPAERAGKEADRAVKEVGQQIEKAGGSIQDAAKTNRR